MRSVGHSHQTVEPAPLLGAGNSPASMARTGESGLGGDEAGEKGVGGRFSSFYPSQHSDPHQSRSDKQHTLKRAGSPNTNQQTIEY